MNEYMAGIGGPISHSDTLSSWTISHRLDTPWWELPTVTVWDRWGRERTGLGGSRLPPMKIDGDNWEDHEVRLGRAIRDAALSSGGPPGRGPGAGHSTSMTRDGCQVRMLPLAKLYPIPPPKFVISHLLLSILLPLPLSPFLLVHMMSHGSLPRVSLRLRSLSIIPSSPFTPLAVSRVKSICGMRRSLVHWLSLDKNSSETVSLRPTRPRLQPLRD